MFSILRNMFKTNDEKEDELTAENMFQEKDTIVTVTCEECLLKDICSEKNDISHLCENAISLENYDSKKDTILVIDDNEGMISFLSDDFDYFGELGIINKEKKNILLLSSQHAAFTLKLLYTKLDRLNIKWAIIDITLGGSKMTEDGNIKYTGVDVFEMIYDHTPDIKYIFYTGNNLNPYIKSNEKLIGQFRDLTGGDIKKYVLFKTSMDIETRRKYICDKLFNKKYSE